MKVIIILFFLFALSFFLTYLFRLIALKKQALDLPNERSSHTVPTPRVGGLAIVLTWYIGLFGFFYYGLIGTSLFYALMCGALLAIVSFIDDLVNIKPIIRLIVHFVVVVSAFVFLNGIRPFIAPHIEINYLYITYPLAIIGMVWFINLYNFMDGINGFASIEAITIALFMYFFTFNAVNLLLVVAVLGFLFWNWPKAKIFMGDVGSTQLGFVLVVLGIYFHNELQFSIVNWIMLSMPFWFDATFTLFRRWRRHEKITDGHKKHAYQRLVLAGFSHTQVGFMLIATNIAIILLIVFYRYFRSIPLQIAAYVASLFFLYYITKLIDKKVPF